MKFDIEDILPSGEYDEKRIFSFVASPQMTIGCYSTAFNSDAPNSVISKNIKIEDGLWRIDVGYNYDLNRLAEMELNYHIIDILRLCHKKYARASLTEEIEQIKEYLKSCSDSFWRQKKYIKKEFSESAIVKYMIRQIEKRTADLFNLYANEDALGKGVRRYIFNYYNKSTFSFDLFDRALGLILKQIKRDDNVTPDYKSLANHQRSKIDKLIESGDARNVVYFRYTHAHFSNCLDDLSWSFEDLGVATSKYISVADKHVHSLIRKSAMQDDFSIAIASLVNGSDHPFKCVSTFGATCLLFPKPICGEDKLFLYTGKTNKATRSFILTKSRLHVSELDSLLADLL